MASERPTAKIQRELVQTDDAIELLVCVYLVEDDDLIEELAVFKGGPSINPMQQAKDWAEAEGYTLV